MSFNWYIVVFLYIIFCVGVELLLLGMEVLFMIFVFNIFVYVVFGSWVEGFNNFIMICEIILVMMFGKVYFMELSDLEVVFGFLFFVMFVIIM